MGPTRTPTPTRGDSREDVGVSGDFRFQLATSRTRTTILADLSDTRAFSREDIRRDARVYTFTKLHDRRITNVGVGICVGVGPVEFQLYCAYESTHQIATCCVVERATEPTRTSYDLWRTLSSMNKDT